MRKKVWYHGCDCGEGRLEEIAKTGKASGDYIKFYECNLCPNIYSQKLYATGWCQGGTKLKPYEGKLTKDDIKQYIPQERGGCLPAVEQRIMNKKNPAQPQPVQKKVRKKKKVWYYQCDCQQGLLRNFASTKHAGYGFMKFYSCNQCDNLYWQKYTPYSATKLIQYKGQLTKDDIREHIPNSGGANLESIEDSVMRKKKNTQAAGSKANP